MPADNAMSMDAVLALAKQIKAERAAALKAAPPVEPNETIADFKTRLAAMMKGATGTSNAARDKTRDLLTRKTAGRKNLTSAPVGVLNK